MTTNQILGGEAKGDLAGKVHGTLVQELTAKYCKNGLPPDIDLIVSYAARAGMGENDPSWIWLLPVLLRQVTPESLHIQFQALASALSEAKSSPEENVNLQELMGSIQTMRSELNKFPKRIQDSLKPVIEESISDTFELTKKSKFEIDDKKVMEAMRTAFFNLYVFLAIGFGGFFGLAAFIVGMKYGVK
jgi:hypothetical protein